MYGCMHVRSHATHGQAWCKRCKMCITTRIFKMNILCSCYWGAAIQECSQNIFVLRSSHWDVFISKAVLNLWSISFKNTCDGVQFGPLMQKSYISSRHFAKQLLLWKTSQKLHLCSLLEFSTEPRVRLIFLRCCHKNLSFLNLMLGE